MKIKTYHKLIACFMLFLIYIFMYPLKVEAADSTSKKDEVFYLKSTQDIRGCIIDWSSLNSPTVRKVVIPKEVEYVLPDSCYEIDYSFVQGFQPITPNYPNLVEVEVDPENPYLTTVDGILYSKDLKVLYYCPPGKVGAVVLPDEVEKIDLMAFQGCTEITSITFPSSLKQIYVGAFGNNSKLNKLIVSSDNTNFMIKSNVLFSKDGEILYLYPQGVKDTYYYVPYGVRRIHPGAFMGNQTLNSVYIPETVDTIGIEAFKGCSNLIKVKLCEGLQTIEAGAFLNCSKLKELTFPKGLLYVYQDAIKGCNNLLSIVLPESIQQVPENLNEVKNRVIYCYSLYNLSWSDSEINAKNNTFVYLYQEATRLVNYLKKQGVTVKYLVPSTTTISPTNKAPSKAIKGTGKPDTSWYNENKTTFTINNPDQLAGLEKLVLQGKSMLNKTIILGNDLDLSCYPNWEPIGVFSSNKYRIFRGTFDGKNHTIYNLRINRIYSNGLGLFGAASGEIKNLIIKDADIIGDASVGILCGNTMNKSKISNCFTSGKVRGNENVGGLIGRNNGNVVQCSTDTEVKGIINAGGIAGYNYSTISNCISTGEIFSYNATGGISGNNRGEIVECTNKAMVDGYGMVGGIVGTMPYEGTIKASIHKGFVKGNHDFDGIIGYYSEYFGKIEDCETYGEVVGRYSEIKDSNIIK
ncbi:leucine-rich repeat domain-containing protein [Lachnoclostridium phytofermentans]|uniref:GLUG domain protein n=1 Tax=Lachnoclostridium phytofermentans (strain ATCC 700394 / DSM 18823 / ISDg) TaxID=357809 RepID=A9KHS8_LACP7|nr:leucine-rich repeat domain-containing protein [Lachnoclostridium phytofermentans]ABX42363.1 hypothetical protein Cphy_1995 [Lachnoclostridium phytofermentans ISDg]